jgi:L-ascorbate metabolism protein UlaG (beta-lactamase superfamily)
LDPDVLFVTIGGWESNIENALKNAALLRPRKVVPMHWETLWRSDGKARDFADAVRHRFPSVECVVPDYNIPASSASSRGRPAGWARESEPAGRARESVSE